MMLCTVCLFHADLETEVNSAVSVVSFNHIIMANPTEHQTIYTTLKRIKEAMNNLGQTNVPVVFDMGLLTKALEITWANPECSQELYLATVECIY